MTAKNCSERWRQMGMWQRTTKWLWTAANDRSEWRKRTTKANYGERWQRTTVADGTKRRQKVAANDQRQTISKKWQRTIGKKMAANDGGSECGKNWQRTTAEANDGGSKRCWQRTTREANDVSSERRRQQTMVAAKNGGGTTMVILLAKSFKYEILWWHINVLVQYIDQ